MLRDRLFDLQAIAAKRTVTGFEKTFAHVCDQISQAATERRWGVSGASNTKSITYCNRKGSSINARICIGAIRIELSHWVASQQRASSRLVESYKLDDLNDFLATHFPRNGGNCERASSV